MTPLEGSRNNKSDTTQTCREDNIVVGFRLRGICNVSKVSCHVACAIQILCHAIPSVRSALGRLATEEETFQEQNVGQELSSEVLLLEELIDFVRVANKPRDTSTHEANHQACYSNNNNNNNNNNNCSRRKCKEGVPFVPRTTPWNPHRLYQYLQRRSNNMLAIDPYNVGDATRSLSCLLRLLSQEGTCGGLSWKALLDASVWEGETLQIIEGRRLLERNDETTGEKEVGTKRRFLHRIKPAAKNKPMASPMVLKFSPQQSKGLSTTTTTSNNNNNWSVMNALNEIVEAKTMQGSNYPWENLSPDTYTEKEILCRHNQYCDNHDNKPVGDDDGHETTSDINSDDDSSSGNDNDSDSDSDSNSNSDSSDYNNWSTSKRLEIKRIPRVWLLHLDRPLVSINKLKRSLLLLSTMTLNEEEDHKERFSLINHIHVPIELNPSSIGTTTIRSTTDGAITSDFVDKSSIGDEDNGMNEEHSSSGNLFLRGAIVQMVELDDCDDDSTENEEDRDGNHSVTLLRTSSEDAPSSWLLIDDDKSQLVSEEQAMRLIGGVLEDKGNVNDSDIDNGPAYFAASLLVYSISEDGGQSNSNDPYALFEKDIVSSWKERKEELAAAAASQEALVGKRISVKWAKGKFYSGTVTRYDISTGKHQVTYYDGDVKVYNLSRKTIKWID